MISVKESCVESFCDLCACGSTVNNFAQVSSTTLEKGYSFLGESSAQALQSICYAACRTCHVVNHSGLWLHAYGLVMSDYIM